MTSEEKYFEDDDLASTVWNDKYRLNSETLDEFFYRLASEFAKLDNMNKDPLDLVGDQWADLSDYGKERFTTLDRTADFLRLFQDFKYIIPGGSVLAGLGSNKAVSLSNCFVVKTEDSIGQIFDTARDMSEIYKRRGGVGLDLSVLRPAGAEVNNAAKTTGGVVPFMELYSTVTNTIGQDGRRGALMLSIDINHPDSPDFIKVKQDLSRVTGANVSVRLNDKFMKAVKNDENYTLRWPSDLFNNYNDSDQEVNSWEGIELNKLFPVIINKKTVGYTKRIKAKELWESIIHCAWSTAEPGILFWDTIVNRDPAGVYEEYKAVSTNPCGEIPLSPYDSCRLIATNLFGLVKNPFTATAMYDPEEAYKVFYEAQIIGDILVDLELDAVYKIIENTIGTEQALWKKVLAIGFQGRRTGVGITALADFLAALNKVYTSVDVIQDIMGLKMRAELDATIDLAIIHGPFPAYIRALEWDEHDSKIIGENDFYKFLGKTYPEASEKMRKWGRRNISWNTIAPTGSISILAGTSSGAEPVFRIYYTRKKKCNPGETPDSVDQNGIGYKHYNVVHGKFKEWYNITRKEDSAKLEEISPEVLDLIIKQSPWYQNLAEEISPEGRVGVQSILQQYTTHSISSTVNVAKDTSEETIASIYLEAYHQQCKGITVYRDGCRSGILVKTESIKQAIEQRPPELECRVEQFKNEKKDWVAFVGLFHGRPYEIFTGPKDLDTFPIPSSVDKGFIIKVKHGDDPPRYDFRYVDSYGYTNTLGGLSRIFDKEYWNYARFVSALLRSGILVEQIVKIVEGLSFTNRGMNSWKAGIIRALKSFIANGTEAIGVVCENCGGYHVVYEGGCLICKDCGSSKCG